MRKKEEISKLVINNKNEQMEMLQQLVALHLMTSEAKEGKE